MRIVEISHREILEAPNAAELFREYAAECSLPEIGEISPQPGMYEALERSGGMQAFGAYEGGTLIGFATLLIYVVPHYGRKIASPESMFLARAERHSGRGAELMGFLERHAKEKGCEAILYSAAAGSRLEKLLSRLRAYRRCNSVFARKL